jgi:hypothetical protein
MAPTRETLDRIDVAQLADLLEATFYRPDLDSVTHAERCAEFVAAVTGGVANWRDMRPGETPTAQQCRGLLAAAALDARDAAPLPQDDPAEVDPW